MNVLSALLAGITEPRLTLGTFGPLPILRLPLNVRRSQANTHWHIIGTSGSVKSFFLAHLFLSLLKHGSPVTLIDPHGDLAKLVLTARMTKLPNQRAGDNIGKNLRGIFHVVTPAFQG